MRVLVTATNAEGSASQASNPTATVTAAGPVNTVAPAISGTARRAETLTATPGTWSGNDNTFAYQWQRGGVDIAGATGATYTPVAADVGATLRVRVTATNPDGSASRDERLDGGGAGRAAGQHEPCRSPPATPCARRR